MKRLLYILTAVLLLAGCEPQSELVTVMKINNIDWQGTYVESGATLQVNIASQSQSSAVQHIIVESDDAEFKSRNVLDSTLAIPLKKVNLTWFYTLPYYADTTRVKLTARSYDQEGNTMSYSITMNVAAGAEKLHSLDNITLYSAASEGKSAFSFATMQPVYLGKDSTEVAFYDVLDEQSQELSRIWHSESGLLFSRSENFDFSEATVKSIENVWPNMVKSSTIKNLKADDVILLGKDDNAIGVIKILYIIDESETEADRYIFSLKIRPEYVN